MKKLLLLSLLPLIPLLTFAQLKVKNNGYVRINSSYDYVPAALTVGVNDSSSLSSLGFNYLGLYAKSPLGHVIDPPSQPRSPITPVFRVSILGDAVDLPNAAISVQQRAAGVMGKAGNTYSGYNYGVFGTLVGNKNGAGIFASTDEVYTSVPGRYAGYFLGDTYVNGILTATSLVTPSDMRLKTNVETLDNEAINNLLKLDIISYNYKTEVQENKVSNRHYGLSAQELKEIYPDLVYEGQDGYLGVNYVELVPVLIRAIQELKEEIDGLRGQNATRRSATRESTTDVGKVASKRNILYQNTPNPFNGQTVIRFQLAENVSDAAICIFDMQGKMLREYPVSSTTESVSVNGYELGQGMFLYSLIVNGQEIDTKKMIITK